MELKVSLRFLTVFHVLLVSIAARKLLVLQKVIAMLDTIV